MLVILYHFDLIEIFYFDFCLAQCVSHYTVRGVVGTIVLDRRRKAQNGFTALIRAAWNGHPETVRLLVELGAIADAKDHVRDACCAEFRPCLPEILFFQ